MDAWGGAWSSSWGGSWGEGAASPAARGGARKIRFYFPVFTDDEEKEELPPPTKKRIKVLQKAVLAQAGGLLGVKVPPPVKRSIEVGVLRAYTVSATMASLQADIDALMIDAIRRINDDIEAEDEEIILMGV